MAPDEKYVFCITDNGIGLPKDLNQSKTMRMPLIRGLAEQLGGTSEMISDNGLSIYVVFDLVPTGK